MMRGTPMRDTTEVFYRITIYLCDKMPLNDISLPMIHASR